MPSLQHRKPSPQPVRTAQATPSFSPDLQGRVGNQALCAQLAQQPVQREPAAAPRWGALELDAMPGGGGATAVQRRARVAERDGPTPAAIRFTMARPGNFEAFLATIRSDLQAALHSSHAEAIGNGLGGCSQALETWFAEQPQDAELEFTLRYAAQEGTVSFGGGQSAGGGEQQTEEGGEAAALEGPDQVHLEDIPIGGSFDAFADAVAAALAPHMVFHSDPEMGRGADQGAHARRQLRSSQHSNLREIWEPARHEGAEQRIVLDCALLRDERDTIQFWRFSRPVEEVPQANLDCEEGENYRYTPLFEQNGLILGEVLAEYQAGGDIPPGGFYERLREYVRRQQEQMLRSLQVSPEDAPDLDPQTAIAALYQEVDALIRAHLGQGGLSERSRVQIDLQVVAVPGNFCDTDTGQNHVTELRLVAESLSVSDSGAERPENNDVSSAHLHMAPGTFGHWFATEYRDSYLSGGGSASVAGHARTIAAPCFRAPNSAELEQMQALMFSQENFDHPPYLTDQIDYFRSNRERFQEHILDWAWYWSDAGIESEQGERRGDFMEDTEFQAFARIFGRLQSAGLLDSELCVPDYLPRDLSTPESGFWPSLPYPRREHDEQCR